MSHILFMHLLRKIVMVKITRQLLPLMAVLAVTNVHATDGYFAHSYGMKAQGMGGVGIALHKMQSLRQPTLLAWG